jgi:hypothetical protein
MAEYECQPGRQKGIETIADLHAHLQTAIELEHATIPAYLTALYSIRDGSNPEAALVIRGVVIEEMLHLTLAANILNAVGGAPNINGPNFVPRYPTRLPHSASQLTIHLQRFNEDAVDAFMAIEHPPTVPVPQPQPDQYDTIGQFYEAIRDGIGHLVGKYGEGAVFSGQRLRQVTPQHYYGGAGHIHVVTDEKTADIAIREIIDQGEGADDGRKVWEEALHKTYARPRKQAAHYYRFQEIKLRQFYRQGDKPDHPTGGPLVVDYDAVWPMCKDTQASDFNEGSEIRRTLDNFNQCYKGFLNVLHAAFNGQPDLIARTVPMMYDLKYKAQALMKVPRPDCEGNLGPTWEWVPD